MEALEGILLIRVVLHCAKIVGPLYFYITQSLNKDFPRKGYILEPGDLLLRQTLKELKARDCLVTSQFITEE